MSTSITRELIADVKAAARIGHSESLQVALDGLRDLPEVSGNARLSAAFIDQVILPLGQILADSRLSLSFLQVLGADPLAAVRAASAAALARRYLSSAAVSLQDLNRAGRDARSEVRAALAAVLAGGAGTAPDKLLFLVESWVSIKQREADGETPGARLRMVALQAGRGLASLRGAQLLPLLAPLHTDTDPEVQVALVSALVALAEAGLAARVLEMLKRWSQSASPNTWVIAEALSASWAREHLADAGALLDTLEARTGSNRHIANARKALDKKI